MYINIVVHAVHVDNNLLKYLNNKMQMLSLLFHSRKTVAGNKKASLMQKSNDNSFAVITGIMSCQKTFHHLTYI